MHIPRATYRLQFTPAFGFRQAQAIVPYLASLGISDLYASPIFAAVPGSLHGYDVTDPNRLNPELGTRHDFEALIAAVKSHRMAWLQDIVPNHMAFHPANRMLMDVLEKKDQSEYAGFFDIRNCQAPWAPPEPVVIASLGESADQAVNEGKLQLVYDHGRLWAKYYELRWPLLWDTYPEVLSVEQTSHPELKSLLQTLDEPGQTAAAKEAAIEGIRKLCSDDPDAKACIDRRLNFLNHESGPDRKALKHILSGQAFRPAFWRDANAQGNYRRFFHLTEFIAVNAGKREVFECTHRLISELVEKGCFQGLRIDHIDGLYQPLRYLARLCERFEDLYIVVEKILNMEEKLPPEWPVQGTTGYDFLNYANGLFCDPNAVGPMTDCWRAFTGIHQEYPQMLAECKRLIMEKFMECDLSYLAQLALQGADRIGFRLKAPAEEGMRQAIKELIIELTMYRTYLDEETSPQDARRLETAFERAVEKHRSYRKELKLLHALLFEQGAPRKAGEAEDFALRFQQLTGPVMAKGLEDTCFYRYNRLISLNEVGGEPSVFGIAPGAFDAWIADRAWTFTHAMNATSTHDTKRGEDARARLNVLTEMPDLWRQAVERWATLNEDFKRRIGQDFAPSRNDEYLLYQAMIGSFPFEPAHEADFFKRLKDFAVKAAREAKVHTNWTDPQSDYEEALGGFIDDITQPARAFLKDFRDFSGQTSYFGMFNSLSQTLIKLAAPGVPDFYQGCELWNFSMVDPDNRGAVDFERRTRLLAEIRVAWGQFLPGLLQDLLSSMPDGRVKMYMIWKMLHLRAGFGDVFERGDYLPLEVRGQLGRHLHAFARTFGERAAVIAVPRFLSQLISPEQMPLGDVWGDTEIILPAEGQAAWYDCFTEERLDLEQACRAADLLKAFPVACIVNVPEYHLKPATI